MKKILLFLAPLLLFACNQSAEKGLSPAEKAEELNNQILTGWNTWDNRSILTHVLLPEELAVVMQLRDGATGNVLPMAFTGNRVENAEVVRTIAHTPDGSYTDFTLEWRGVEIRVQSVSEEKNLYVRVNRLNAPAERDALLVSNDFFYNRQGTVAAEDNKLSATVGDATFTTRIIEGAPSMEEGNVLAANLSGKVYVVCGKEIAATKIATSEIDGKIDKALASWKEQKAHYGDFAESFNALENAVNWTVVYDHRDHQPVLPVSRPWSYGWGDGKPGGWIRFCWDNFFVAYMQSVTSRDMAYSEAIQMCNYVDTFGFVPNFIGPFNRASRDRSQPPVGSMMVKEIYKAHPEKWFLEKTFPQLLEWNRWWTENRDYEGYLVWGSTPFVSPTGDRREKVQNVMRAARYESGLDNSPMFDGVIFDSTLHIMMQGDVGLMGLYVGDCEALADIAAVLGNAEEEKELRARAEFYREQLQTMWDDDYGLFLNKNLETGALSRRISPTNFYALIGQAASQEQAERMMNEHFYNPDEFWGDYILPSTSRNDTAYTGEVYWRGSIWAPMNFLVYYGLRNYDLPQACKDLSEKSRELLMKEWNDRAYVRENYNADTGGAPSARSDHFYHWGALLGMINLIEEGYVPPTEKTLQ